MRTRHRHDEPVAVRFPAAVALVLHGLRHRSSPWGRRSPVQNGPPLLAWPQPTQNFGPSEKVAPQLVQKPPPPLLCTPQSVQKVYVEAGACAELAVAADAHAQAPQEGLRSFACVALRIPQLCVGRTPAWQLETERNECVSACCQRAGDSQQSVLLQPPFGCRGPPFTCGVNHSAAGRT